MPTTNDSAPKALVTLQPSPTNEPSSPQPPPVGRIVDTETRPCPVPAAPSAKVELASRGNDSAWVSPVVPAARPIRLIARDPFWLYVEWDYNGEELGHWATQAHDKRIVLKVFQGQDGSELVAQLVVPASRQAEFIFTGRPDTQYHAELGYTDPGGHWIILGASPSVVTPPVTPSEDKSVYFATVLLEQPREAPKTGTTAQTDETIAALRPSDAPLMPPANAPTGGHESQPISLTPATASTTILELAEKIKAAAASKGLCAPIAQALPSQKAALNAQPGPASQAIPLISASATGSTDWSPEKDIAMAGMVSLGSAQPGGLSSLEISGVIAKPVKQVRPVDLAGPAVTPSQKPGEQPAASPTGPWSRPAAHRNFWFNINAELIIFGATEPDAQVTLGGLPIKLRPDGTFSCRLALPDGVFELPAVAVSANGQERRQAILVFGRQTQYDIQFPIRLIPVRA